MSQSSSSSVDYRPLQIRLKTKIVLLSSDSESDDDQLFNKNLGPCKSKSTLGEKATPMEESLQQQQEEAEASQGSATTLLADQSLVLLSSQESPEKHQTTTTKKRPKRQSPADSLVHATMTHHDTKTSANKAAVAKRVSSSPVHVTKQVVVEGTVKTKKRLGHDPQSGSTIDSSAVPQDVEAKHQNKANQNPTASPSKTKMATKKKKTVDANASTAALAADQNAAPNKMTQKTMNSSKACNPAGNGDTTILSSVPTAKKQKVALELQAPSPPKDKKKKATKKRKKSDVEDGPFQEFKSEVLAVDEVAKPDGAKGGVKGKVAASQQKGAKKKKKDVAEVPPEPAPTTSPQKLPSPKAVAAKEGRAKSIAKSSICDATKEKSPKRTPKKKKMNFQDQVYNHMFFTFKPFTLKTLAAELKTTDTALNHVMLSLVDKGIVVKKDFSSGKNGNFKTLYWAVDGVKAKEAKLLLATPQEQQETKAELAGLQAKLAALRRSLTEVEAAPSNQDLSAKLVEEEASLAQLRQTLAETQNRIRAAQDQQAAPKKSGGLLQRGPAKSAAQLARESCPLRMKVRINNMRQQWVQRKEKCTDFVEQLADGMEKKPKDVVKLLDLETDEMEGVVMPPKKVIDP